MLTKRFKQSCITFTNFKTTDIFLLYVFLSLSGRYGPKQEILVLIALYSKTCVKQTLKIDKKGLNDNW